MMLTCDGRNGRCDQPVAELNDDGEIVLKGRHHSERHETRISIANLVKDLPPAMRQRILRALEGSDS